MSGGQIRQLVELSIACSGVDPPPYVADFYHEPRMYVTLRLTPEQVSDLRRQLGAVPAVEPPARQVAVAVGADDAIVIEHPMALSPVARTNIAAHVREAFPGRSVLVLDEGMRLLVTNEADAPGADAKA